MKLRARSSIRFGRIELEPVNAILRKDGVIVKLSAQPMKALTLLASRPNQLVTREELRQEIWGTTLAVDFEHGLNTCIRQIRTALGEPGAAESVIETVPRLGYRFTGDVRRRPTVTVGRWTLGAAALLVLGGGLYVVGRLPAVRNLSRTRLDDRRAELDTVRVSLPAARVGAAYTFNLNTYYPRMATIRTRLGVPIDLTSWSASGLPPGLAINFDGRVSGTPAKAGTYSPSFLLVHRQWYDANGDRVPDCDLTILTRNGECGDSRTPNPLHMTFSLTVQP